MMPPNRTVELASVIATKTEVVDDYLNSHGLPPLSFEPMEKSQQYILPDSVQAAQNAILEATDELHALMLGPMGILTQQLVRIAKSHALASISDLLIISGPFVDELQSIGRSPRHQSLQHSRKVSQRQR